MTSATSLPETGPDAAGAAAQAAVVAFLEGGAGVEGRAGVERDAAPESDAGAGASACRRIDTHAAHLFLRGDRVWKLKRAVRFPYLDFSTPELRREALEREDRLNRRTAPALYRGVHAITREADGRLAIDGAGPPVDWVLEMRRFPDDALLATRAAAGPLPWPLLDRLADRIHDFHMAAPAARVARWSHGFAEVIDGNARSLTPHRALLGGEAIDALIAAQRRACAAEAARIDSRARAGLVRHVHGDLHLANIALIDGEPTAFDCLEFDDALATTDTLYDLAFLLMDLWQRGLRTEANLVFNRYVDRSGDEQGCVLLPLFLSVRATVRAHVAAARAAEGDAAAAASARDHLTLAAALLAPAPAGLVAIGGLSGSGKSAAAKRVAGMLGIAPGARLLRSDVVRKRLAGVAPETRLGADGYTPERNAATYAAMETLAVEHLRTGRCVVWDAVLGRDEERRQAEAAAAKAGVRFTGLWLEAEEGVRLARVAQRRGDASDADAAVARAQSGWIGTPAPDEGGWARIDATPPLDQVAAAVRDHCATLLAPGGDQGSA